MRPGTNVAVLTQTPPNTPPVSLSTWFIIGVTAQGPLTPQTILSFQQFQSVYGVRNTASALMSDSVETFFKEGGGQCVVARTVGPAAVAAFVQLKDASAGNDLLVTAIGTGVYANGYKVVVTGTGPYTITIEDSNSNVLEVSNSLTTVTDAVSYGQTSNYVTITANGANIPAAGTFTLAGGADDNSNITTTQYQNSINEFTYSLGPGHISAPGITTSAVQTALANHAATNNRIAFCDLPDTAFASSSSATSTLTSDAAPITALGTVARQATLWAPWADIAPVVGGFALRQVPPSAFAAAAYSAVDQLGNPNLAAAGVNGELSTPVDLRQAFADTDRQTLNSAGVNVIRAMRGGFRIYGFRTAVNSLTDPLYVQLPNVRLDMYIVWNGQNIEEEYFGSQIDGQGLDAARYGNALNLMLNDLYSPIGALYGDTAQDAFSVDTGTDVNTPTSEAGGNLTATLAYRRSPGAEQVNLNLVRVSITQAV